MKLNVLTEKKLKAFTEKKFFTYFMNEPYPVPGIHFRDKVKVILKFSNNNTKELLEIK